MYILIREREGKIETLKDSNSSSNKVFSKFASAETFAKKLNQHTHPDKKWTVSRENLIRN